MGAGRQLRPDLEHVIGIVRRLGGTATDSEPTHASAIDANLDRDRRVQSPNHTGDTFFEKFTFQIVNPPLPEINVPPAGGNFTAGTFVSVSAGQTSGRTFKWTRNGADLPPQEKLFCPRTAVRKFRTAPLSDPGAAMSAP